MCGDSTMIDDFEKLMNDQKADITFTSPPYNAGKTPKESGKYNNYEDDLGSVEYAEFLHTFTSNCLLFSDYVFCNIQSISGNKVALIDYLYGLKDKYADTMIWNKGHGQPAMARRVLNSAFEYVHVFSNEAKRSIGKRDFRGTISNIFEMSSRSDKEYSNVHKATFPVSFADKFVSEFSESSVIEPFNGTGTTIISCEKNKRKCFSMELSEQYTDISIIRWEKYTGKKAILEATGKTYEELKMERLNG